MSDADVLLEIMGELIVSLMQTLGPVVMRAVQANLISPTEQAELATIQAAVANLFVAAGGTKAEMDAAVDEARNRMRGVL